MYTILQSNGVTSAELIIRKSQELETAPLIKTSPPQAQKLSKKTSVLSIKPKVMASPNAKHRKTSNEKGLFHFIQMLNIWQGKHYGYYMNFIL